MQRIIKIEHLNKIYNEKEANAFYALSDIELNVNEGELIILKGVSGSGKSTLLAIIGALSKPTSGSVEVDGQSVAKLPDLHASEFRASTIGFIFQSFNLFDELNVHDNVALPLVSIGLSQNEIDEKAATAMKLAHITHKKAQRVQDLSGGEKQRCAIARALVNDPKIILCDEPTANLDRENSLKFIETLKALKALGKTVLVATHDTLFEELDFIDRIVLIENGKITG